MSGDGQLGVHAGGRMLESFPTSSRAVRRGKVQVCPQRSDALYAPRLQRYEDWDSLAIGALGVGASMLLGTAAAMIGGALISPQGGEVQANFAVTALGLSSVLGGGITAGMLPGFKRGRRRLRSALSADFQTWVKARYGLDIHPEKIAGLIDFIAAPKADDQRFYLTHRGKVFKVVAHGGKFYIEQQRDVRALDYVASSPMAIEAEDVLKQLCELPGEAGLLGGRLLELLALSVGEEPTVEQDHVLRRVRADALQVIALHAKLVKLHAMDAAGEAALRDTVASLAGEVDDIIQQWRQEVRQEVEVQRGYVRERRLHAPALLTLSRGTDIAEAAPESVEHLPS